MLAKIQRSFSFHHLIKHVKTFRLSRQVSQRSESRRISTPATFCRRAEFIDLAFGLDARLKIMLKLLDLQIDRSYSFKDTQHILQLAFAAYKQQNIGSE